MRELHTAHVSPIQGAACLLRGAWQTLGDAEMRRQIRIALIINGLTFLVLLAGLIWLALALTAGWVGDGWLHATLGWLARLFVVAGIVLVAPVLYALVGEIVLPVYRGKVFELARRAAGGPPIEGPSGVMAEARSIALDLRKLARLLLFSGLAFLLNLVPVVGNLAYPVVQVGITAHTMGWDLLGRHLELHGLRYREQLHFVRRNRGLTLAVGAVAALLCLVPVAQLVFVTTNVAGAGILSARLDGAQ